MTKEEAIGFGKMWLELQNDSKGSNTYEFFVMAIEALEQQPCEDWHGVPSDEMTLEQARQAVKDLRKMLPEYSEQNPYEDAISRQAVLDKIYDVDGMEALENSNIFAKHYANMVKSMPSITPKPKTGHWIWIVDESPATPVSPYELNWAGWACDCCRKQPDDDSDWDDGDNPPKYKYCPNCGAKMAESEG